MKTFRYLVVLILAVALLAVASFQSVADAGQTASQAESRTQSLDEEILGIWEFPVDGYYLGFDEEGRLCYGGSELSVAAKRWCNDYTLSGNIVTETCMGGPEDRNCPLGGGSCQAEVDVDANGRLVYRILYEQCNMLGHKVVPPRQFRLSNS